MSENLPFASIPETHLPLALGDCSPEEVKRFFEEEFSALVFASTTLLLMGFEISRVDFEKRRVILSESKVIASDAPTPQSEKVVDSGCSNCKHMRQSEAGSRGHCTLHGYTVLPTDSCDLFEEGSYVG